MTIGCFETTGQSQCDFLGLSTEPDYHGLYISEKSSQKVKCPTCPEAEQESLAREEWADKAAGPYSPGTLHYGSSGHLHARTHTHTAMKLWHTSQFTTPLKITQKVIHAEQTAAEKPGINTYDSLHHVIHLPGLLLLPPPSVLHVTQYGINNGNSFGEAGIRQSRPRMTNIKEILAKLKKGWSWIYIAEVCFAFIWTSSQTLSLSTYP